MNFPKYNRHLFFPGILLAGMICIPLSSNAQKVGVHTASPQESFHVLGGLLIEGGMIIGQSAIPAVYNVDDILIAFDTSAILYDSGGPTGDYGNNESYDILLAIDDAIAVRVSIDSMDLEAPYDYIILDWPDSDNDTITGTQTGVFLGANGLSIRFVSNAVNTGQGFKLRWDGLYQDSTTVEPEGVGGRLHWISGKYALRSGFVDGDQWDAYNIGNYSTAFGFGCLASGAYAMAGGQSSEASGDGAFAVGRSNQALGNSAVALGRFTSAEGEYATGLGYNTSAAGTASTAMGENSWAPGAISLAAGLHTIADAFLCTALGKYNVGTGDPAVWVGTDPVFEIGIGVNNTNRANAMTIFKNAGALWEGTYDATAPDLPPTEGAGTRMMWYPDKAAFRAGHLDLVTENYWDKDSIGDYSFAAGLNTKALGVGATAFGQLSTARGGFSIATGINTMASGFLSTAFGQNTKASGFVSTAIGQSSTASGQYSTAMGWFTEASGTYSTAMGQRTAAQAQVSTAIGRYNVAGGDSIDWIATDPLFEIGIGTDNSNRANAMTIFKNAGALWGGEFDLTLNPDPPPAEGAGTRMMWYPEKAAFRVGRLASGFSTSWDQDSIGDYSFASGQNTKANGANATAMGKETTASGTNSTALGSVTIASGQNATAMGVGSVASGDFSTAMGSSAVATGSVASALGNGAWATGHNAIAMGPSTVASGDFTTAVGNSTNAEAYASFAMGRWNTGGGNAASWISTDPIFEIGIGGSSGSRANAMTVLKNGTVKIDQKLQAITSSGLEFATDDGSIRVKIDDQGDVGIGTTSPGSHRLYVNSSGSAAGGSTGYFRNTLSSGIALSVENSSSLASDNVLLVTSRGSVGNLASFDSYHGVGVWDREFRFTNTGDGRCDGSWIGGGADYAEYFPKADPVHEFEPGDVISMSPTRGQHVVLANDGTPGLIVGVYSTNPVVVGNASAEEDPKDAVLVGLMGVIETKVNGEAGPIHVGDYLTISSTPGVATKATVSCTVIGRAMDEFTQNGQGLVKVLVEVDWVEIGLRQELEMLRSEIDLLKSIIDEL